MSTSYYLLQHSAQQQARIGTRGCEGFQQQLGQLLFPFPPAFGSALLLCRCVSPALLAWCTPACRLSPPATHASGRHHPQTAAALVMRWRWGCTGRHKHMAGSSEKSAAHAVPFHQLPFVLSPMHRLHIAPDHPGTQPVVEAEAQSPRSPLCYNSPCPTPFFPLPFHQCSCQPLDTPQQLHGPFPHMLSQAAPSNPFLTSSKASILSVGTSPAPQSCTFRAPPSLKSPSAPLPFPPPLPLPPPLPPHLVSSSAGSTSAPSELVAACEVLMLMLERRCMLGEERFFSGTHSRRSMLVSKRSALRVRMKSKAQHAAGGDET